MVLVVELFVGGQKEQAASNQEGGWVTGYQNMMVLFASVLGFFLEYFPQIASMILLTWIITRYCHVC